MYEGKKVLPLSMNNYRLLFNSCQIAKFGKDELREYEGSKHIVVMRNGHIYTMDVIDENGEKTIISLIIYSHRYKSIVIGCLKFKAAELPPVKYTNS